MGLKIARHGRFPGTKNRPIAPRNRPPWQPRNAMAAAVYLKSRQRKLGGALVGLVTENVLGAFFTTAAQNPTGGGSAGKIRVNYGAGGTTSGGEFTVQADGTIVTDVAPGQTFFTITIRPSRAGSPGAVNLMGRFLYSADGSETDTIQVGQTFAVQIDDSDEVWRETFEGPVNPATGAHLWLELARDEAGLTTAGGIAAIQPTATLLTDTPAWEPVPSASLTISQFSVG